MNREQAEQRLEFLRRRQGGIGGTDVSAILGFSKYGDARTVYHTKTREYTLDDVVDEDVPPPAQRGRDLEPVIRRRYAEETGRKGRQWPERSHPDHPHLVAHVDWELLSDQPDDAKPKPPSVNGGPGVAEFKAPGINRYKHVLETGELTDRERFQLIWYLTVTGRDWGGFGLYCPYFETQLLTPDLRMGDAERDIGRMLVARMDEFWRKHVEERIEPDPDEWDVTDDPNVDDQLKATGGYESVDADEHPELAKLLQNVVTWKADRKAAREQYRDWKDRLADHLVEYGGPTKIEVPGIAKICPVTQTRTSFDEDGLRSHRPIDRDAFERAIERGLINVVPTHDGFGSVEEAIRSIELDLDRFTSESESTHLRIYPQ